MLPVEEVPEHETHDDHHTDRGGISVGPGQLRHIAEVHSVDPGDHGPRDGDRAEGGDLADKPVQLVRHLGLKQIEDFLQILALQIRRILQVAVLPAQQCQA